MMVQSNPLKRRTLFVGSSRLCKWDKKGIAQTRHHSITIRNTWRSLWSSRTRHFANEMKCFILSATHVISTFWCMLFQFPIGIILIKTQYIALCFYLGYEKQPWFSIAGLENTWVYCIRINDMLQLGLNRKVSFKIVTNCNVLLRCL